MTPSHVRYRAAPRPDRQAWIVADIPGRFKNRDARGGSRDGRGCGSRASPRLPSSRRLCVDPLFEPLARLEREHLACRDLDGLAGLWIPAAPRRLPADPEMTEAHDLHVFTLLEAPKNNVEDRLDDR